MNLVQGKMSGGGLSAWCPMDLKATSREYRPLRVIFPGKLAISGIFAWGHESAAASGLKQN